MRCCIFKQTAELTTSLITLIQIKNIIYILKTEFLIFLIFLILNKSWSLNVRGLTSMQLRDETASFRC